MKTFRAFQVQCLLRICFLVALALMWPCGPGVLFGGTGMDVCKRLSVPTVAALVLAGTVACADSVVAPESDTSYTNPYIEELAEALGPLRLFEPRLSGGFQWGECIKPEEDPEDLIPSALCSTLEPGSRERQRVQRVWLRIHESLDQEETAELLHAQGVGHLLWSASEGEGAAKQLDWAIDKLTRAREMAAEDSAQRAAILNDLAVAYFVQAAQKDHTWDLIEALEKALLAVESAPALLEGAFNLAMIVDRFSLAEIYDSYLDTYLTLDPSSDWSREAAARNIVAEQPPDLTEVMDLLLRASQEGDDELAKTLISQHLRGLRRELELQIADELSQSEYPGTGDGLYRLTTLAGALSRATGDRLFKDTLARVESLAGNPTSLREGARQYREALRLGRREQALPLFREAMDVFATLEIPLEGWARYHLGVCESERRDYERAEATFLHLREWVKGRSYPILEAQTARMSGLVAIGSSQPAKAAELYESGLQVIEAEVFRTDAAGFPILLAEAFDLMGESELAWRYQFRALARTRNERNLARRHVALHGVVLGLFLRDRTPATMPFLEALSKNAESWGNPAATAEVKRLSGRALVLQGYPEAALEEARAGLAFADRETDASRRKRVEADLRVLEGEALAAMDPLAALSSLSDAISTYKEGDFSYWLPQLYLLRGRLHRAQGNMEEAREDLDHAIEWRESIRASIPPQDPLLRQSYLAHEQAAFDEAIHFYALELGDEQGALELLEQASARSLLDRWNESAPALDNRPSTAEQILQEVPERVTLISYSWQGEELLVWVLRKGYFQFKKLPSADLERQLRRFLLIVRQDLSLEPLYEPAGRLYDILLAPIDAQLRSSDTLVIVPGRGLEGLPFAALFNGKTQRFLVEERTMVSAPSAATFLRSVKRARSLGQSERPSLLVVADPAFDQDLHPTLNRLDGAFQVAPRLVAGFNRHMLLRGAEATKGRVLEVLDRFRSVTFGAHAEHDLNNGNRSRLLLAPDPDVLASGVLTAADIAQLELSQTELVTLASCRGVGGATKGREGVSGLVRPFLAAGATSVIATLWEVEDQVTSEFTLRLHERLAAAMRPAQALRETQTLFLKSENKALQSPAVWAGWVHFGAN